MNKSFLVIAVVALLSCNSETGKLPGGDPSVKKDTVNTQVPPPPPPVNQSTDNSTPETLGRSIFNAVRNNDFIAYSKYTPTRDMLLEYGKRVGATPEELANVDDEMSKEISKIKRSFEEAYSDGESEGIVWADAVYSATRYTVYDKNGYQAADLEIEFTHKGVTYKLLQPQVQKLSNWFTFSELSFKAY